MNATNTELCQRRANLQTLSTMLETYRDDFMQALKTDLDKPPLESMNSEWVLLMEEIRFALKNLKNWIKPIRYSSPIIVQPAKAFVKPEPLGTVLIVSPWNYPLYLALAPAIGALAAGNSVVVKPSEYTPNLSGLLEKIVSDTFPPDTLRIVNGGAETAVQLLEQKWDKVLFTGSEAIGQKVYEACAKTMTPVVLELGGKNPTYIHANSPLGPALKRILWAKFFNAGQTCVAPDYLIIRKSHFETFARIVPDLLKQMFGQQNSAAQSLPLSNQRRRMARLLEEAKAYGDSLLEGGIWQGTLLSPTIVLMKDLQSPLMKDEIFGPILPVICIGDDVPAETCMDGSPLALYLFSPETREIERIAKAVPSGSLVVNGALSQMTVIDLPFGGVGHSGFGRYRGKAGFDTFSNYRSWLIRHPRWELPLVYQPYPRQAKKMIALLRCFFRWRF